MHLGILGGTFDPVHLGHSKTAEEIGRKLDLDRVYLIPSASPPHKKRENITSFHHRLQMAQMAAAGSEMLGVLDLEGKRPGLSYSIETLLELQQTFGSDAEIFFLLGMDAFLDIQTWKAYQHLFDHAHFVIIQRAGFRSDQLDAFVKNLNIEAKKENHSDVFIMPSGKTLFSVKTTPLNISSTNIRNRVKRGESIHDMVAGAVLAYITEKGLYQTS